MTHYNSGIIAIHHDVQKYNGPVSWHHKVPLRSKMTSRWVPPQFRERKLSVPPRYITVVWISTSWTDEMMGETSQHYLWIWDSFSGSSRERALHSHKSSAIFSFSEHLQKLLSDADKRWGWLLASKLIRAIPTTAQLAAKWTTKENDRRCKKH